VVVPDGDHGMPLVQPLKVEVGPVLAVAGAVVGQRAQPARGLMLAADVLPARADLVEVVPEVHHHVHVTLGQAAVGVEEAVGPGGAGDHAQADVLGDPARGGPRAADRRGGSNRLEPVVVGRGGLEVPHVDLHGEVPLCRGLGVALGDDVLEVRVRSQTPPDGHGGAGGRRDPRPDDHAVRLGVAAGDAMGEPRRRRTDRQGGKR
jgi:hypothetical protein